jgi:putative transcriptional regulator
MIRSHLSRILGEKKLRIADVARESGLSRKAITYLFKETGARVDFDTLDRVCKYLGCTIGELLEYVPGDAKPLPEVPATRPRRAKAAGKDNKHE